MPKKKSKKPKIELEKLNGSELTKTEIHGIASTLARWIHNDLGSMESHSDALKPDAGFAEAPPKSGS